MWKKIGWPRMDGCENCQGNALLLIHGRDEGEGGAACAAAGYQCQCDERGGIEGKGPSPPGPRQASPRGRRSVLRTQFVLKSYRYLALEGSARGHRIAQGAHRKTGPRYPPSRRLAERDASECPSQPSGVPRPWADGGAEFGYLKAQLRGTWRQGRLPAASSQQPHSGVNVGSKGVDGFQGLVPRTCPPSV